jgi:hypothetical protein
LKEKRKRGHRWSVPAEALAVLQDAYQLDSLPSCTTRKKLAETLKVTPRQVTVWFQNKRQRRQSDLVVEPTPLQAEELVTEKDDFGPPPAIHSMPPMGDMYHVPTPSSAMHETHADFQYWDREGDGIATMESLISDAVDDIFGFEQYLQSQSQL